MTTLQDLALGPKFSTLNRQSKTMAVIKALARHHGFQAACSIAESFNHHSGTKKDMFGFIDVVAIDPTWTRGVQVCGSDWQPHIRKFREECPIACARWLASPYRILELWGWRKVKAVKKDGTKGQRSVWMPRIQVITQGFLDGKEKPWMIGLDEWATYPELMQNREATAA